MKSDIAQIQHRVDQLRKATDRIKREIEEVTEREHELRTCGSIKTLSLDLVDSKVRRISEVTQLGNGRLKRATSTPHILEHHNRSSTQQQQQGTKKMTNGVISSTRNGSNAGSLGQHHHHQPLRFAQSPSQKGLMHRFLATRGKIYTSPGGVATADSREALPRPTITLNPESIKALNRSLEMRNNNNNNNNNNGSPKKYAMDDEPKLPPTRKNFVPVEKKIQKELSEMRERENELRLMRSQMLAKSQPNLADIGTDTDSDIYDGSASSLRSGASSSNLTEDDAMTISMPAEKENKIVRHKVNGNKYKVLCTNPHPRRRSNLIEKWESLIAAKKQASENGSDNANTV